MGRANRSSALAVPAIVVLCILLSIVVAFAALISVVTAEADVMGSGSADPVASQFGLSHDALLKLKVRDLKAMLKRKGATCEACVSKVDLIERIAEVRDWDDVPDKKPEFDASSESAEFAVDYEGLSTEEKMAKLTERLKSLDPSIRTFKRGKDGKIDEAELEEAIRDQARRKGSVKDADSAGSDVDSGDSQADGDAGASANDKPDL